MQKILKSPWTINISTALLSFILTVGYDSNEKSYEIEAVIIDSLNRQRGAFKNEVKV